MTMTILAPGTRVVLLQDSRNPYTHVVHMEAGREGTVTREANLLNEDQRSETIVRWDNTPRPARTLIHAVRAL